MARVAEAARERALALAVLDQSQQHGALELGQCGDRAADALDVRPGARSARRLVPCDGVQLDRIDESRSPRDEGLDARAGEAEERAVEVRLEARALRIEAGLETRPRFGEEGLDQVERLVGGHDQAGPGELAESAEEEPAMAQIARPPLDRRPLALDARAHRALPMRPRTNPGTARARDPAARLGPGSDLSKSDCARAAIWPG